MISNLLRKASLKNDDISAGIKIYLEENYLIILILIAVAFATYGFELFNFNLHLDDEVASIHTGGDIWHLAQGRWGGFFLTEFLFPFPVIPFVPLFVTLLFHIGAILLIMDSLEVKGNQERAIIGAIGVSYPGIVFMYYFSTGNFVMGVGLFCVALSLFIYTKNTGGGKLWGTIPAAFAISIYQPFILVLISVYLLYIIFYWDKTEFKQLKTIINISVVNLLAAVLYYIIQKFLLFVYGVADSHYVDHYFDLGALLDHPAWILQKLFYRLFYLYAGDETIYGIKIRVIGIMLFVLGLGIIYNVLRSKMNYLNKILIFLFLIGFLISPFIGGLFTKGYIPLRSFVGMPIILTGWAALGLKERSSLYKSLVTILTLICIFQFISSSNHLFAASHLALVEDRILGAQLIERIEEAQSESDSAKIKYLEMVGFVKRPSTPLIPIIENIGASFFTWDQGDSARIVSFLRTLGYLDLDPSPDEQRYRYLKLAGSMPVWPAKNSVKIDGDVVIVKFDEYSQNQMSAICQATNHSAKIYVRDFCP